MMRKVRISVLVVMIVILGSGMVFAKSSSAVTQGEIDAGVQFCKEYPVSLQVDGVSTDSAVTPVIIKESTLIPVRTVFENMGGKVEWNGDAKLVEISLGTSKVKLTIDSKTAFVNGAQKTLDVPATIVNGSTMIPVRFVGESLDCKVDWENDSRTVKVNSPSNSKTTPINAINVEDFGDKFRVVVKADGVIGGYKTFAYDDNPRFGLDLKFTKLSIEAGSAGTENEIFTGVRYSQFDDQTVRIVADLKQKVAGKISLSEDKHTMYIDFYKNQETDYANLGDVTAKGLDVIDWKATGTLVVIDPGHGGQDPGSQGNCDGEATLNEKDVNLDVATRLYNMLRAAGVNTYILRNDDTAIGLYERAELANNACGSLYLSIHNNSSVSPSANGVEAFYFSKNNESDYGISSEQLAKIAQEQLAKELGIQDRKAKQEPGYAVLNKTDMPAIIIEGAFISNQSNLQLMRTDDFREKYALSAARAVIQVLNASVE